MFGYCIPANPWQLGVSGHSARRRSGVSLMLAKGTPLHVVSEALGHASIAITKDV